jgi:hypothetical protein
MNQMGKALVVVNMVLSDRSTSQCVRGTDSEARLGLLKQHHTVEHVWIRCMVSASLTKESRTSRVRQKVWPKLRIWRCVSSSCEAVAKDMCEQWQRGIV